MVRICFHPDCKTRPVYNYEGETKGLYCVSHKKDGMIDIKHKTCIHPDCKTRPHYNYEGETKGLYCVSHKKDGMIDIKNKTCIHPDCKTQPYYNYEGETKTLYCASHKKNGMINVKDKTCIHPDCKTRPHYNYEGETKTLYCASHKKDGMINVKDKTCHSEWCNTLVTNKYDGYCVYCYMNIFPDKPILRNYKTKEYSVIEYIKETYPELDWIYDKKISGGCSKRRPDAYIDLGYQVIIMEVDENQHINYDCSCENKRIMELSQDLQHRPIIFIRFNPDEYIKNNKTITSCWGINGNGICNIKKNKKTEWNERLNTLNNQINYWINPTNRTNKTVEVIQLFYDDEFNNE